MRVRKASRPLLCRATLYHTEGPFTEKNASANRHSGQRATHNHSVATIGANRRRNSATISSVVRGTLVCP